MISPNKKNIAKELYIHSNLSMKEIGEMIGVSPQRLSYWKKQEDWSELKLTIINSEKRIYVKILEEIERLQKEDGFNAKKIREYTLLLRTIRQKDDLKLSIVIDGFMSFTDWLAKSDLELAKIFNKKQCEFIEYKLRQLNINDD